MVSDKEFRIKKKIIIVIAEDNCILDLQIKLYQKWCVENGWKQLHVTLSEAGLRLEAIPPKANRHNMLPKDASISVNRYKDIWNLIRLYNDSQDNVAIIDPIVNSVFIGVLLIAFVSYTFGVRVNISYFNELLRYTYLTGVIIYAIFGGLVILSSIKVNRITKEIATRYTVEELESLLPLR